jgi:hypothetical protein
MELPRREADRLTDILHEWQSQVEYEPTYVMRNYGVPCLIARFDGVMDTAGKFQTYEIQGGCGWIGYAGVANNAFKGVRDSLMHEAWPAFKLLMPPAYHNDDELWLKRISLEEALQSTDPLLIRRWLFHELRPELRAALLERSVISMFDQNDKSYGLALGWWKLVMWQGGKADLLPWDSGFVLKPLKSAGSTNVMIWNPAERRGRATRTQIETTLERHALMYLQTFIPPMCMDIEGQRYNMMYRPFFGYDPRIKQWTPMHGVWTARPYPNLRLHGSSDAISGPLLIGE